MNLFHLADPFEIVPGNAPIVVGAPHHGVRPNVDADLNTGPIALALAKELGARAVVVSDLRRRVDVNKAPARFDKTVRRHAVRYQNELFYNLPRLVVEIHGHVSGQYAIEVATGFELNPAIPGDQAYLQKLQALREILPGAAASRIGTRPSVGVYPLDQGVRKAATDTFTFQKIRRARNLAGLEWFGLHIELHAELRTSKAALAQAYVESLGAALAAAIRSAFGSKFPATFIPVRADYGDSACDSMDGLLFKTLPAPEKPAQEQVILLHPADLETLGVLGGDRLNLCNGPETVQTTVAASQMVRAGHTALPDRLRRQVGAKPRQPVWISRPKRASATAPAPAAYLVVGEIRPGRSNQVWASPRELNRLGLVANHAPRVNGRAAGLQLDTDLPERTLAISSALADALTVTVGEVLRIEEGNGAT